MSTKVLEAGYELDCLIAENVFGRKARTQQEMRELAEKVWAKQPDRRVFLDGFIAIDVSDGWEFRESFPSYSTDLAAAWRVVEKLAMTVGVTARGSRGCWAEVHPPNSRSFADTAPLAICKSALKSFGL